MRSGLVEMRHLRGLLRWAVAAIVVAMAQGAALAADKVRIVAQRTAPAPLHGSWMSRATTVSIRRRG